MEPRPEVHPLAVKVMAEIGIDISHQRPKPVSTYLGKAVVRHIIIVCDKANGTCPRIWPGALSRTFMPFDDPAKFDGSEQEKLVEFRKVRDLIGRAMETWEPEFDRAGLSKERTTGATK
jgi:arsenate reductase